MTQDEIIEMARQAGFHKYSFKSQTEQFNRFAKLITEKQQRTWVGLTEEEKIKLWDRAEKRQAYQGVPAFMALIQEVEAKLKELNT
jgi:L-rhamnose mutarotase